MVAFFLTFNFMKIRDFTLGIAFALIWSSAFTSARISMFDAPPFLLLSLRFLISGIIAIGLAHIIGQSIQFSRSEWYAILIFGVFQNTIYLGLNFVAMQWIDASLAATIASILPLIITIFLWLFFKEKLSTVGLLGLVIGYGRQAGHTEIYRGAEYVVNFVPKIKLEMAVADEDATKVVAQLSDKAKTGKIGDGKIFVLPLEEAMRVRTGETGNDAL